MKNRKPLPLSEIKRECPRCHAQIGLLSQFVKEHTTIIKGPAGQTESMPADIEPLSLPPAPSAPLGGGKAFGNCALVILTAGIWLIIVGIIELFAWVGFFIGGSLWLKVFNTWQQLFYCPNCFIAYDPKRNLQIERDNVRLYLYAFQGKRRRLKR